MRVCVCSCFFFSRSKTSNGIQASEQGQLKANPAPKSAEDPAAFISVQGEFSYTGADGQIYTVRYIADENGYVSSNEYQLSHYESKMILKSLT